MKMQNFVAFKAWIIGKERVAESFNEFMVVHEWGVLIIENAKVAQQVCYA